MFSPRSLFLLTKMLWISCKSFLWQLLDCPHFSKSLQKPFRQ